MYALMNKSKTVSIATLLTLAVAQQAGAATISFGGQAATDGSNKTSLNVNANNTITSISDGFFVSTFDTATAIPGIPGGGDTQYNVAGKSDGCAINSPLAISPSDVNVLNVRKGSDGNVAAAPAGDTTCYAYTTPTTVGVASYVDIDYKDFLANIGNISPNLANSSINYLGFYWGSVDAYNSFEFYSDDVLVAQITGPELLAQLNGKAGDQVADSSNVYVNINFSFDESFNKFRVITSGIAGEFDNIVVGLDQRPVSAPASLAFLGLGLLGLGLGRRFKK
ncbi:PEP-CTERM sorting domain-containing protein [uncultured Paraglaciecola sp.]|uniref:Npun_F0296 family exosortase-dependent surface protein n=1 Tax=uncultured Paraglaciecola sp. TaxID=1765024 RepID=UPI0030D78D1D|tara:strand:+ start:344 stop:1183 length:840 start_codon:yes stop_codon:yes gene_type:complete